MTSGEEWSEGMGGDGERRMETEGGATDGSDRCDE
jgi:hypothetical protein